MVPGTGLLAACVPGMFDTWMRMLRDYGTTVADQVRRILERGLRGEWPTPDEAASKLSMTKPSQLGPATG